MAGYRHIHQLIEAGDTAALSTQKIDCPILKIRYLLLISDYPSALHVAMVQPVRKRQLHLLMNYIHDKPELSDQWPKLFLLLNNYQVEVSDLQLLLDICPSAILIPFLQTISLPIDGKDPNHGYLPATCLMAGTPIPAHILPPPLPNRVILSSAQRDMLLSQYPVAIASLKKISHPGIKYVIDGANVMYSNSGVYSPEILVSLLGMLEVNETLIVLNRRHYKNFRKALKGDDACHVEWSPRGVNDDEYAIAASILFGAQLVSNDLYRDHRARHQHPTLFDIWVTTDVSKVDDPTARMITPIWQIHDGQLWGPVQN